MLRFRKLTLSRQLIQFFVHVHYELGLIHHHHHHYYYITPCEFLTAALADGLSLESPLDSRTLLGILTDLKKCCSLNDLRTFSDFQLLQFSY